MTINSGGKVVRAGRLMHGKTSLVHHDGAGVFADLPEPCEVGRYHSLIAAPETLPPELTVTARTPEAEIMGVRHRSLAVEGVQFHPESILTPEGPRLLGNFLAQGQAGAIAVSGGIAPPRAASTKTRTEPGHGADDALGA